MVFQISTISTIQAFEDTKAGVKGLVDVGVTKLPRIFIHPPKNLRDIKNPTETHFDIPLIDLDGVDEDTGTGEKIVDRVREAWETWGCFQIVNHGLPVSMLEEMLDGVRRFNEQDTEIKKQFYSRDFTKHVTFNCNFDLFSSPAANWRDTIYCLISPNPPQLEDLPTVCMWVYY
ncbi:UNVERIFIED_CONTAM: 1-aminocyclopropane-1-carboxylate oxidase [Sesamum calycinum]|uniref:1-aminocyclopropane-1-carboxylate oxidase n=1 Tax=Sesamum calycinum TaxID=2727403 RepID=A0AAW2QKS0_9LAMI